MSIGAAGAAGASAAGAGTAPGASPAASLNGALPPQLQQLAQTLQDFSSAEILIALMMMKAAGGGDDRDKSSGAAGVLAGMAIAGLLGQGGQISQALNPAAPAGAIGGVPAGAGGSFSATA